MHFVDEIIEVAVDTEVEVDAEVSLSVLKAGYTSKYMILTRVFFCPLFRKG